jgi:SAM-dependent methyltransferase
MPRSEPPAEGYRDDLAYIHDAGFGHFARNAAPVLLDLLRRQDPTAGGRVIDLGCGSGFLSEQVAAAGYDVLGIDLSPAMVELARQRVSGGEFRVGSLLTADLPPCVAVAAIGECFNFLLDRSHTRQKVAGTFRRIHEALRPGGFLLFDVSGPGRVPGRGPHQVHRVADDWAVVVTAEEDRARGVLRRHITSFRRVGEWYRRDDEVHRLRLFGKAEIVATLSSVGFRVRTLRGYGDLHFGRGQFGFLARKP